MRILPEDAVDELIELIENAEEDAGDDSHASVPTYVLRRLLEAYGLKIRTYELD